MSCTLKFEWKMTMTSFADPRFRVVVVVVCLFVCLFVCCCCCCRCGRRRRCCCGRRRRWLVGWLVGWLVCWFVGLLVVGCLLFTVCCLLFAVCCWLFVVCWPQENTQRYLAESKSTFEAEKIWMKSSKFEQLNVVNKALKNVVGRGGLSFWTDTGVSIFKGNPEEISWAVCFPNDRNTSYH